MRLELRRGLPYAEVALSYRGQNLKLSDVLIDTGSAGTIFSMSRLAILNLTYEPEDPVHRIRGVGGSEFVFCKRVDKLAIGELWLRDFSIEVGAMDYGFALDGIIGMDFLLGVGAIIDLGELRLKQDRNAPQKNTKIRT